MPIKDEDELSLAWVLPYTGHDIDRRPLDYFSHLLGHEGQNSIFSYFELDTRTLCSTSLKPIFKVSNNKNKQCHT